MDERKPTYEELQRQLAEANSLVEALRNHEIDAIIGEKSVAVVRLREVEEQLEHARKIAEERARELEFFSYSVSHDLRAPLRAIAGFSTILSEKHADRLDASALAYLNRIVAGVEKMSALIEDILTLSKVSRHELSKKEIRLDHLAWEIVTEIQREEPQRKVEIVIAENMRVSADLNLFSIALTNLIRNAWKFTSKTPDPQIEIGGTIDTGENVFFIRDNGAGFDMKHGERLFMAFQRLHSEADFPGIGIGLAVVKRVIAKPGGRVWAYSEPGIGSTFYFTI
ncbi:sensor histidine kinase [Desulfopila inferna]|uniref:sensor histidine kinase n=1 Tax=Desulfopila inferna TaxID=468528 RepID=UPI001965A023|nr:ATP-binding protein [Desulfopila inferna]MBM9603463.1 hypothetical protein [Desulfopila inferna]